MTSCFSSWGYFAYRNDLTAIAILFAVAAVLSTAYMFMRGEKNPLARSRSWPARSANRCKTALSAFKPMASGWLDTRHRLQ